MLNKHPGRCTDPSVLFLQALQFSDYLIVSLVTEVLPNVGINKIT